MAAGALAAAFFHRESRCPGIIIRAQDHNIFIALGHKVPGQIKVETTAHGAAIHKNRAVFGYLLLFQFKLKHGIHQIKKDYLEIFGSLDMLQAIETLFTGINDNELLLIVKF